MQQFQGRPAERDRREQDNRRQFVSTERQFSQRESKPGGEPHRINTRAEQRRISRENDLYERQSI